MIISQTPIDILATVRYRRSRGNGRLLLTGGNTAIFHTFSYTALQKNQRVAGNERLIAVRRTYRPSILTLKQHESPEQSP